MRKTIVWVATTLLCGSVWADVCTDLTAQYTGLISFLDQQTQAAISQTTDPAEQQALLESYQMQKTALESELSASLAAANCTGTVTDPGTGTTDPGTGTTDPGTGTTDPGTTDPGTGPTDPGTTDPGAGTPPPMGCEELMSQIRTQAQLLSLNKGFSAGAQYVRSRKAEIQAVCGNYGHGRRQVGGNEGHGGMRGPGDDHGKCDVSRPDVSRHDGSKPKWEEHSRRRK